MGSPDIVFGKVPFPQITEIFKVVSPLFTNVLEITIYSSVIIALVLIFGRLIKKRYGVKWRYFVWLVIAARLMIPFNISLPKSAVIIPEINANMSFSPDDSFYLDNPDSNEEAVVHSGYENSPATYVLHYPSSEKFTADGTITEFKAYSITDILSVIWAAGVILFLIYQITAYMLFKKRVKRWRAPADEETRRIFRELKADMEITRDIHIYRCSEIDSPMLIGFVNPMVLLPKNELNAEQLALVLRHELTHLNRRDLWYKLALTLANAIHWFNPLVYAMTKSANNDLELICDSITISAANKPDEYARAMLEIMKNSRGFKPALSTHFLGGKQAMKERFGSIFDTSAKKRGIALLTAVLAASALGGALVACSSGNVAENTAEELYEYKSPYIGNNWNSIELFNHIPLIADMQYSSTELDTDSDDNSVPEGYGLKLFYSPEDNDNIKKDKLGGAAVIFLSLIDNADYVMFVMPNPLESFSVTKRECVQMYGDLFTAASESTENFSNLYKRVEGMFRIDDYETSVSMLRQNNFEEAIDRAIAEEYKNYVSGGEIGIAVHKNFVISNEDDIYTVYVHSLYTKYGVTDGVYTAVNSLGGPGELRFKAEPDGSFTFIDYIEFFEPKITYAMPENFPDTPQNWEDFIKTDKSSILKTKSDQKLSEYLQQKN